MAHMKLLFLNRLCWAIKTGPHSGPLPTMNGTIYFQYADDHGVNTACNVSIGALGFNTWPIANIPLNPDASSHPSHRLKREY